MGILLDNEVKDDVVGLSTNWTQQFQGHMQLWKCNSKLWSKLQGSMEFRTLY